MPRVVNCLLVNADGKLLVLKRSDKVKTYKGLWGGVAGYIEEDEEPYETALKEIREETGLKENDIDFIKKIDSFKFIDFYEGKRYDWEVFPFLFKTRKKDKIHIDWEHSEYRWITPSEIGKIDTVPHFNDIVFKVLQ
jgi:8-oxo-dGTP pyrophosphatase MutT (NUDIX family)